MSVRIIWTDDQMRQVLAALEEGAEPRLEPHVAAVLRKAGVNGRVELDLQDGQILKRWCDARRERATEEQPDASWTRIVARVNEAVQPAAPAKLDRQ